MSPPYILQRQQIQLLQQGHQITILYDQPWERVFDDLRGPEWTTWFVGGKVNIARVCVHDWARRDAGRGGGRAARRERRPVRVDVRGVLAEGDPLRGGARRSGIEPGDRVGIFMPMRAGHGRGVPRGAHVGVVQVPIFSGFAAPAIAQRLQDAEAKVLVTASHSFRRGREMPMRAIADEAVADVAVGRAACASGTARRASGTSSSGRASCRRSRSTRSTLIS